MPDAFDPKLPVRRGLPTTRTFPRANEGQAPPEFGKGGTRVGVLTLDLSSARVKERFEIGGSALWAVEASDANANIAINYQEESAPEVPFRGGEMIQGLAFSRIFVSNPAQPGKTLTLLYVTEDFLQFRITNPFLLGQQVVVLGTVPVSITVNAGANLTNLEKAGIAGAVVQGAAAGDIPQIQVFASGAASMLITRWTVQSDADIRLTLRNTSGVISGGSAAIPNKYRGKPNHLAQIVIGTLAPFGGFAGEWLLKAYTPLEIIRPDGEPLRADTNTGWMVHGPAGFHTITSTAEIIVPAV